MFQEKEKKEYFNQKAPEELKNRTWSSIQQEKGKATKQRRQGIVLAVCFAGVIFASNLVYQNSTIVKVDDVPISYFNVNVGYEAEDIPFTISEGRNRELQGEIPMEINVSGSAHVEVSEGSIRLQKDSEIQTKEVTQLDIQDETVIFWYVEGDSNTATCTITTENAEYKYVMEKDGTSWKIRLKQRK